MKNRAKMILAWLLAAALLLPAAFAAPVLPVRTQAADTTQEAFANGSKVGEFFSTDNVWYDAVTGNTSGLIWQGDNGPSYDSGAGMTAFNRTYVKIANSDLLSGVSAGTGMEVTYTYIPGENDNHRHVLSLGLNEYNGSESPANHLYISATATWMSGRKFPVVGYHNGSGETINAYPLNGPDIQANQTYQIRVTITVRSGVQFQINGVSYDTAYYNSNFNDQRGNIQAFLNAASGFRQNYIGASRWPDPKLTAKIKDLCIYNAAISDFNKNALNAPSFNATVYHYSDPATNGYSNVVFAPPPTNEDSGMGIRGADNSDNFKDIEAVYFKLFTPQYAVMVYDGVHEVYAPIQMETKRHNKANVQDQRIYYAAASNDNFVLRQKWHGYMDSAWQTWAYQFNGTEIWHLADVEDTYVGSTNDTSRFWWNALKFNSDFSDGTFFKHEQNVRFTMQAFFDYTIGSTSKGTGTITTQSDYYVINYKPVYDILTGGSATKGSRAWYEANVEGKEWMYTDASLEQCVRALYLLQSADPHNFDYAASRSNGVSSCATAIQNAVQAVGNINLVKKTGTYTFQIDGVSVASERINYGDDYSAAIPTDALPADTNLTTYTFNGWQKSIQPQHGDYIMDGDITYTADLLASDNLFVYRNGSSTLQNIASKYGSITAIEGSDAFTLSGGRLSFRQDAPTSTESVTASISGRRQKIYVVSSPVVC